MGSAKKKLKNFILQNIFPIILVCLTVVICVVNFKSATWLSGWDTLHPEFDFLLNLKRVFGGVWQEHQGLGAVASQSHPAEIPRIIFLFLSSLFLPVSFLRYFYFFLCLILGPLGVFFFLERIVFKNKNQFGKGVFSFAGALFYLLNLGTLQHFYVPLEMFAVHFASLGWLFLFATQYLETQKKKYLWFFALVTLLAAPMSHTATLFYAYFLGLLLYLLAFILYEFFKNKVRLLKKTFFLIAVTLVLNAFWLLPNLYFVFNHGQEVVNSKIQRLFTNEAISQGRDFANPKDQALLKNFLFNWGELVNGENFGPLLNEWQSHLTHPLVSALGYLFFALILLGLFYSLFKKHKQGIILMPLLLISYFFLILLSPFLNQAYLLITKIPLLHEILRFPFTKFSILLMFGYAFYFSLGFAYFFELVKKIFKKSFLPLLVLLVMITSAFIFYMKPAFQGNLISPSMKVSIPEEYFQLFKWFDQQDDGRILKLPLHTFWGWVYHDWGYQGAGFIWFGLKQPILDREFDRWNPKNEKAYQELSYAVYSQNLRLFEDLLAKYQIRWLLLDKSVIAPQEDEKVLFSPETEKLLLLSSKIRLTKEFGFLKVYTAFESAPFSLSEKYPALINFDNPPEDFKKTAEEKTKTYGTIDFGNFNLEKPFVYQIDLKKINPEPELCGQPMENQIFGLNLIDEAAFGLYGKNSLSCLKIGLDKIVPKRPSKDFLLKIDYANEGEQGRICLARRETDDCLVKEAKDNGFFFQFPANREPENYQLVFLLDTEGRFEEKQSFFKDIKFTAYPAKKPLLTGIVENFEIKTGGNEYVSLKEEKRDSLAFPKLSHDQSYALLIESENKSGFPLRFCLTNYTSKRCDLYDDLENGLNIFFIPKSDKDGLGYDLNLSNYAAGPIPSVNFLKSVKIVPLDYEFLKYEENPKGEYLTNNQSYEPAWRAYVYQKPFNIKSLGKPVLVNGWKNGWPMDQKPEGQIIFFFLPQLLEYFGFFLILVLIVLLVVF